MHKQVLDSIRRLNPCSDALAWVENQTNAQAAWLACERGDWMLWLLGHFSGNPGSKSRKKLVLTACKCARLALKYVPQGEDRPRLAILTVERYAKGTHGVTLEDVRASSAAAAAYSASAAYSAAAYAAYAAAYTAYAAATAAYAAATAAYAAAAYTAHAAAYAASNVASDVAAREKLLNQCATIVRIAYPNAPKLK